MKPRSKTKLLTKPLKAVIASGLAALLSFSAGTLAATGKESWYAIDPEDGTVQISLEESESSRSTMVGVVWGDRNQDQKPKKTHICEEIGSELDCNVEAPEDSDSSLSPMVGGQSILPKCQLTLENCVESLELRSSGEDSFERARFIGHAPGPRFLGSPSLGIPTGTGLSRFSSDTPHSGGDEYSVRAQVGFDFGHNASRSLRLESFTLQVFGTKLTPDDRAKVPVVQISDRPSKSFSGGGAPPECAYSGDGFCGVMHDLDMTTEIRVTLILSNQLTGWLRGRIQQGSFEVTKLSEMYSRVTVSGKPADVPKLLVDYSIADGDDDVVGSAVDNSFRGDVMLIDSASEKAMATVRAMKERVADMATAIVPVWSVKSLPRTKDPLYNECSRRHPGLVGVVSTNAMAFDGAAPLFRDGYFSYNVSGMHYAPNGKETIKGTYDLSIRSDFARCLYGYSNAPISATVSVLGEQGPENVATEVVSERNGWLNLSARGFTFSEKEVLVRIGQSQMKTLSKFNGSRTSLTSTQKSEIRSVLEKSKGNSKFICTGIRYFEQPMSVNIMVRKRAKEACDYAKSLNPNFSFWFQTKPTKSASYAGKVFLVSKN